MSGKCTLSRQGIRRPNDLGVGVEELRVDLMTRLRDLPEFSNLWDRRTTFQDQDGTEFNLAPKGASVLIGEIADVLYGHSPSW